MTSLDKTAALDSSRHMNRIIPRGAGLSASEQSISKMPRRITNGWQWPGSPSSESSEDSEETEERRHCAHCFATESRQASEEKTDRRPRPHRLNARIDVPTKHLPTIEGALNDVDLSHADCERESDEGNAVEHLHRSALLLRWQLAVLGLGVLTVVETAALCFAILSTRKGCSHMDP